MTEQYKQYLDLNIYQIYPRSFCDSNNDGIGDLQGIVQKLDYLQKLGINAIWLCPCFKSPKEDNGYDVADYCDIMDEFGTMEDMTQLISEVHARDIKIILDLVPNHTSVQHRWFQESRKSRDNPYSDYYYWFDTPPNDWISAFGGSAWQFDEKRQQYYLHSYAVGQPDLNWNNPRVVEEMQNIVDFWVALGVDGFRIDVIDQISKDFENDRNCFGPRLHEFIHALFGREAVKHIFTVGECWAEDEGEIIRHCAEHRGELTTLFQFEHLGAGRMDKWNPSRENGLKALRNAAVKWQTAFCKNDLVYSLFTDNHDNNYLLSRVADDKTLRYESATMLAAMIYLLKGAAFLYQGQELGMAGSRFDHIGAFRDVESLNYYDECIRSGEKTAAEALAEVNFGSRDNARHPFPWNGEKNGGFCTVTPWLLPSSRYREINLAADLQKEKSVFRFYQRVLRLRKENPVFRRGDFEVLSTEADDFFVYRRSFCDEAYVVICNFGKKSHISVPDGEPVLTNYGRKACEPSPFRPYEAAVYKL